MAAGGRLSCSARESVDGAAGWACTHSTTLIPISEFGP